MGEKIKTQPQKYPDYVIEGETLYRNIPHRAGSEDVASWKMCVPKSLRETVLTENHDSPAVGHVGSRKTIARTHVRPQRSGDFAQESWEQNERAGERESGPFG